MVKTYKQLFNERFGFKHNKAHSIKDISKLTNYKLGGLQTIYNRGVGAQQWAIARIYSAVNPKSKAHKIDKKFLIKTKK